MSDTMDSAKAAAQLLYDGVHPDCRFLALEWATDEFIRKLVLDRVDQAFDCYERLKAGGYHMHGQFEYNDLDNHAFVVTLKEPEHPVEGSDDVAFVHRDQNRHWVYFLQNCSFMGKSMRIYEYKHDYFNYTPGLPPLKTIVENNGSKYNDARDAEFVVQAGEKSVFHRTERAIINFSRIQQALQCIEFLHCGLIEDE